MHHQGAASATDKAPPIEVIPDARQQLHEDAKRNKMVSVYNANFSEIGNNTISLLQDSDDPSAPYRDLKHERDWHDYAQMETDRKRTGPGEGGQAVHVPESMREEQNALYRVCWRIYVQFKCYSFAAKRLRRARLGHDRTRPQH